MLSVTSCWPNIMICSAFAEKPFWNRTLVGLTRSVSLKWCKILVWLRNFNSEISVVLNLAPCNFTGCWRGGTLAPRTIPERLIICVRLRASSLDCRTAGVLMYPSLGHLTEQTLKIDGGQSIHIWCPGHSLELRGVYNRKQQLETNFSRDSFFKLEARTVWA